MSEDAPEELENMNSNDAVDFFDDISDESDTSSCHFSSGDLCYIRVELSVNSSKSKSSIAPMNDYSELRLEEKGKRRETCSIQSLIV